MGKLQTLPFQQTNRQQQRRRNSSVFCCNTLKKEFNFKCFAILLLTISLFLSAIFSLLPHHNSCGFEAKSSIKNLATVQAFFKLEVPVSVLVPHIGHLEYEINEEIGVPFTKVAILSVHEHGSYNNSGVVFSSLPDPLGAPINAVSLSLLKSSFIELFTQQSKLTFRNSIFGQPSDFEILKFLGGITVIPAQSATIWQIQQTLFNFTLRNSVGEIIDNFAELRKQLKIGLDLKSSENVYVQVSSEEGSTVDPLVTVQASIMSDLGILHPERLKQLAQTITQSPPSKNLGLNYTVFGKVKEISLSSYLKDTLQITPPTPSPAPSPDVNEYTKPSATPVPSPSPSNCQYSQAPSPIGEPPTSSSLAPASDVIPPVPCPYEGSCTPLSAPSAAASAPSPAGYTPFFPSTDPPEAQLHPSMSPSPSVFHGSSPSQNEGSGNGLFAPSLAPSPYALSSSIPRTTFSKPMKTRFRYGSVGHGRGVFFGFSVCSFP